jgi:hypothetical protein
VAGPILLALPDPGSQLASRRLTVWAIPPAGAMRQRHGSVRAGVDVGMGTYRGVECSLVRRLARVSKYALSRLLDRRTTVGRRLGNAWLLAFMLGGATPSGLAAQSAAEERLQGTVKLLVGNVVIAGLAAGVGGWLNDRRFWKAMVGGAAGGATMYVGKRLATADSDAWGLIGRELSAVGASMTRNAAYGSAILDTLIVPIGPLRLYWSSRERRVAHVRVDAEEIAWAIYGFSSERFRFDRRRSIRAGSFVFTTSQGILWPGDGISGLTQSGAIFLDENELAETPRILSHELAHVLEIDYLKIAFGLPAERLILRELGWDDAPLFEYVDLGVGHYPFRLLSHALLEYEAEALEGRPSR